MTPPLPGPRAPTHRVPSLLHLLALLGLAGLVGGLLAATWLLDGWTNQGVSWGPDLTPVAGADKSPLGINVFLDKEADPANVDRTLQMVRAGGYTWVRQAFPWYDIEINAKGDFNDTRFGRTNSAWAKYDYIVDRAQALGLKILARIDAPPAWAHTDGRVSHDPPANYDDYADFVATLVARYQGKVDTFQLWNEPNLAGEWAGTPNAAQYTDLLRRAYQAAKRANPDARILMAPLAPTAERGPANISDLLYLQQMYDAGARPYFDVANVMVYGLGYPPEDRRTEAERLNFSRPILTRAVMERNGDGGKAMWASEYAWISLPPDWTGKVSTWGRSVSEEQQGQYLVDGYRRARQEWPWMGPMFVWNFRDPEPLPGEPATYFQIVNNDFSPRPAYTALQDYARRFPVADPGAHGVDSPALSLRMTWRGDGPTLTSSRVVTATSPDGQASINFQGNRIDLLFRVPDHPTPIHFLLDGQPVAGWPATTTDKARAVLPAGSSPTTGFAPGPAWAVERGSGPIWRFTPVGGLDANKAHKLVVHTEVETDTLALVGFIVSRDPPAQWVFPFAYGTLAALLAWLLARLLGRLFALVSPLVGRGRTPPAAATTLSLVDSAGPAPQAAAFVARRVPTLATIPAVLLLGALFAAYYWAPWQPLAWALLLTWAVAAFLRPDVALGYVVLLLPFVFQPRLLGGWRFAPAETALLLTFGAVVVRRALGILTPDNGATPNPQPPLLNLRLKIASDPFALPALALLAVGTLSLLTVADDGYLRNSLREYRWTIVEPLLLYFLATEVLLGRRGAWRLADGLVAGAALAATGALLFAAAGVALDVEGVSRVYWPYLHPNNLALWLGRVAPFTLVAAMFLTPPDQRRRRTAYALASVPLLLALVLTYSRGAYVGVGAAALAVAWALGWRRVAGALTSLAAAGAGLLVVNAFVPFLPDRIGNLGSAVLRMDIWKAAAHMIADHPIFGIGLDQFLPLYQQYLSPEAAYERFTSHPHNFVLDIWLRLGIIGLLVLAWLAWRMARAAGTLARDADPRTRALALGVVALLADTVVHGLVDNAYFVMDLACVLWVAAALLHLMRGDEHTTEAPRTPA